MPLELSDSDIKNIISFDGLNNLLHIRNDEIKLLQGSKNDSTNGVWTPQVWKKFEKVLDYLDRVEDLYPLVKLLEKPKPLELLADKIREYNRDHPNRNRKVEIVLFRFLLGLHNSYPAEDVALWIDTGLPIEKLKAILSCLLPSVSKGIELSLFIKFILPQINDVKLWNLCQGGLKFVEFYVQLDKDRQNELENCPPKDKLNMAKVLFAEQQFLQGKPLEIRLNNEQITALQKRGSPLFQNLTRYDGVRNFIKVEDGKLITTPHYNENDLIEVSRHLNQVIDYKSFFKDDPIFKILPEDDIKALLNALSKINKSDNDRKCEVALFKGLSMFIPDELILVTIKSEPFKIWGFDSSLNRAVSNLYDAQPNSFEAICQQGCQLFQDKEVLTCFLEIHAKNPNPNTSKDCEALLDQVLSKEEQRELLFYFYSKGKDEAFKHKEEILLNPAKRDHLIQFDNAKITDFKISKLINNKVKASTERTCTKTMLIWRTTFDPNKGFDHPKQVLNIEKFSQSYSITLLSGSDPLNITNTLFDYILIQGHGSHVNGVSRLILSGEAGKEVILDNRSNKLLPQIARLVKPGGVITLESCQAGVGNQNLAKSLSYYCPEATVYAAAATTYTPYYNPHFRPTFFDFQSRIKVVTRAYAGGTIVLR